MEQLAKAIQAVMQEVKGIEKDTTVGSGNYAYQGVSDYFVKKIVGASMLKNGLSILPLSVEPKTEVSRWEESGKPKQSVFTSVITKYLLLHISGESVEIGGYGHGVDAQDKGAGKATTYALKYTLLYLFLIPTGKIDDSDNSHSEEIPAPPVKKIELKVGTGQFQQALKFLLGGGTIEQIEVNHTLSAEVKQALVDAAI